MHITTGRLVLLLCRPFLLYNINICMWHSCKYYMDAWIRTKQNSHLVWSIYYLFRPRSNVGQKRIHSWKSSTRPRLFFTIIHVKVKLENDWPQLGVNTKLYQTTFLFHVKAVWLTKRTILAWGMCRLFSRHLTQQWWVCSYLYHVDTPC